jgi:hypothetical protein
MNNQIITSIFLLLLISSCATQKRIKGSYVGLNTKITEQKTANPESVTVYYEREPSTKVKELGLVEATAEGTNVGVNDLLPELQHQAARMGASGIYKIKIQRYNHAVDAMSATGIAFE